jgi:hypothetical protein
MVELESFGRQMAARAACFRHGLMMVEPSGNTTPKSSVSHAQSKALPDQTVGTLEYSSGIASNQPRGSGLNSRDRR